MYLRRDTLAALLSANAEVTLAQALEELRVPLGQIDVTINPEDWFIIGTRRCWGGSATGAGGAGIRTQVGIRCANNVTPVGLVVTEAISVSGGGGTSPTVEVRANFLEVTSAAGFVLDSRWGTLAGGRSIHGTIVVANNAAASGTLVVPVFTKVPTGTTVLIPFTVVIGPGQSLAWSPSVDNSGFELMAIWREFDLRPR